MRGVVDAGATEVTVNDAHNTMRNIKPLDLHPAAWLVSGKAKPLSMMEGIADGYDCAMFIGYHSRIGEPRGVLGHTYNPGSVIQQLEINDVVVGETALNGYLASHFGVPLLLVSGDTVACEEAEATFLGCTTVATKEGRGKFSAKSPHPSVCRARIEEAARVALTTTVQISKPRIPVTFKLNLASSAMADMCCLVPGVKRITGTCVLWQSETYLDAYRLFLVACAMCRTATDRVY